MAEFSKLWKEHGCSKCGYSFCEKCVSKKMVIPGLTPNPVSVCDNCFNALSRKVGPHLNKEKSRESGTTSTNWWGDDKLPPPSMRQHYANEQRANGTAKNNIDDDLQRRLVKLRKETTDEPRNDGYEPKLTKAIPNIAELEERLAALKDVPVDVIRQPRLMVMNPYDQDDNDIGLSDDAKELLKSVESRGRIVNCRQGFDNAGLNIDDAQDGSSNLSSNRTSDSSIVKRVIKDAEDAPSISSNYSESSRQLYPDFEECVKKTMLDAESAEKDALKFIHDSETAEAEQNKTRWQVHPHQTVKDWAWESQSPNLKILTLSNRSCTLLEIPE
uniref:FYVE-type domain-containing protein n=1 Tax=Ditylenchus dipsaci TaxID=166011 RepID=A0A915EB22_9BILA